MGDEPAMREWAAELVERARRDGVELTGDNGLLTALVQQVLQTGLEVEMTDHLGYERHAVEGRNTGNSRNGSYPKTVTTEVGKVRLDVPRDGRRLDQIADAGAHRAGRRDQRQQVQAHGVGQRAEPGRQLDGVGLVEALTAPGAQHATTGVTDCSDISPPTYRLASIRD